MVRKVLVVWDFYCGERMEPEWAPLSARFVWSEISIGAKGTDSAGGLSNWVVGVGQRGKGSAGDLKAVRDHTDYLESSSLFTLMMLNTFFVCLLAIHVSSLMKYLFRLFAHFLKLGCVFSRVLHSRYKSFHLCFANISPSDLIFFSFT